MKLFSFYIITFSSFLLSQNLVFFNDEESIIFKEDELITINGKEYRYEKALKNRTQIRLLKSGLLRKENIVFDTNKIETFRTHKVRYSTRNAFKKAFKGFKVGFAGCGVFAFGLGYDGSMGISSKIEKLVLEFLLGQYLAHCLELSLEHQWDLSMVSNRWMRAKYLIQMIIK